MNETGKPEQLPLPRWLALEFVRELAHEMSVAHHQGHTLDCAALSGIRMDATGVTLLPGAATPGQSCEEDVCGLGAILYALLTGYWPLSITSDTPAGLRAAPRDERGVVVPPVLLRPSVGVEISELTMAALGAPGLPRLRSADTMYRIVQDIQRDGAAELLPPTDVADTDLGSLWHSEPPPLSEERTACTDRRATAGVTGLAVTALAVLGFLTIEAAALLGLTPPEPPHIVIPPDANAAAAADRAAPVAHETAAATDSHPLVALASVINNAARPASHPPGN